MIGGEPAQSSLLDLFHQEAETQVQVLTSGLLALERAPGAADQLEACMRAAHSLKGAARIVELPAIVRLTHAMEDCFVAAQTQRITLGGAHIELLLGGVDLLARMTGPADATAPPAETSADIDAWLLAAAELTGRQTSAPDGPAPVPIATPASTAAPSADRMLRVTAEHLNRLLGLAGESLVESRWARSFGQSLLQLKRLQHETSRALDDLRDTLVAHAADEQTSTEILAAQSRLLECRRFLAERLVDLDLFEHRSIDLSHRLYDETLACHMRPFADGVEMFPRMIRDLARELGKQARLEVAGDATQVDRDILRQLEAPFGHLLRNALDHGIELPADRVRAGKSAEGVIRLEARHHAGALLVTVSDDGSGVDMDRLRRAIVARRLTTADAAAELSETELLEFLFLPGFTMKETVTDVSGRGVGLDVVRDLVRRVRGLVRVSSHAGAGTKFTLELPVTLSVLRALLVDVGGEPYAFPLGAVVRTARLLERDVASIEGRQHFDLDGQRVGLVTASQVFDTDPSGGERDVMSVVVVGDAGRMYGLIVDRFLGERELVVQPLDPALGKIKDIAAGALLENGHPVLIVDTDDLVRSIDKIVSGGRPATLARDSSAAAARQRKRVLVVDDSLTVRELERKLLTNRGYEVEVAVDGMDGWNAVRTGRFNLVVTDIDMPRMDGIELVTLINQDPGLSSVPVMIVSYKDRDEDRRRGLDAGAAHYLTKGSFHDETLVQAVVDLIGEAEA